jgi:subtilisin family serine protease
LTHLTTKRTVLSTILITFILIVSSSALMSTASAEYSNKVAVIVGFKGHEDANEITTRGGHVSYSYTYIQAVAAYVPLNKVETLRNDPDIAYVEEDYLVHALGQTVPWGIAKIEAPVVWAGGNKGTGIKVAVLDTGIDTTHPDLKVAGGATYVPGSTSYNDDNGHGTHCAGIIAGLDNSIGIVGVAPEASLYAVKVLDRTGSGYTSSIIFGIEWCINNGIQVISMSFGTSYNSQSLESECLKAYNKGIVLVASAGNSGPYSHTVVYPARYSSVIAVAATDSSDTIASFSSRGSELSVAAPGVSILSAYYGSRYTYMSGTSMACPHAAGTVALILKSASLTPVQVKTLLQNTAVDLGSVGFDTSYGYGRIDAASAVGKSAPTPDFSMSAPSIAINVPSGSSGAQTVTITSLKGFSGTVSLSTTTPAGWTATLNPTSPTVTAGGTVSSTITISVPSSAIAGTYAVAVTGVSGSLTHSTTVKVTVPAAPTKPSVPQNLIATPSDSQVALLWSKPTSNGGAAILNYKIYRHTNSTTEALLATIGNALSYIDNAVTNGETHYYRVTAVNSIGESPFSNEASATPAVIMTKAMTVFVTTDKSSYSIGARAPVNVTVRVTDSRTSGGLSSASVAINIKNPSGFLAFSILTTTNSTGMASFACKIQGLQPGTYTVTATSSAAGYETGTGKTTFIFA